jgi:polyhydroxyalkanoate synthesis regulator phasin
MIEIAQIQHLIDRVGNIQDPVAKGIISEEEKRKVVQEILEDLSENRVAGYLLN